MKTIRHITIVIGLAVTLHAVRAQQQDHPAPAAPEKAEPALATATPGGTENGLRFNFRGVPLETVLEYMSKAAGFIIIPEVRVEGNVDVWSHQPLSKDEAVDLLNTILNKNGYAAIRNDRTLTIVSRDEAKKREIPVRILSTTNAPVSIPKTDEMVTQIIPIRYANAVQMQKDLQPLLRDYAVLTANESGNALVLTDTQSNIRRMAEIVRALDTSIANISAIRVFPLRYADATELSEIVKELFELPANNRGSQNDRRAEFISRMMSRGGPGGGGDGGGLPMATGVSEARNAASRVVAVADERTNSLVVSAPDEYIPTIEGLVAQIDQEVDDITELRVFPLRNADPTEMAQILADLFPDETQNNQSGRSGFRFGGPFGGGPPFGGFGGSRRGGSQDDSSERTKKMGKVVAVPDARTGSIIVSAASTLMPQIAQMITQLDLDPAKKQRVFVYSLENADVQNVEEILRAMFEGQNTRNLRGNNTLNNNQNNNPLNNRNAFNQGFGGGGFGGGFGGGTTGGQIRR